MPLKLWTLMPSAGYIPERVKKHSYHFPPALLNSHWRRSIRKPRKSKLAYQHPTLKGFADDMTVISPNISAHSSALKIIDQKASSLDLVLKPEKCVSFLYDGKDIDKRSTFSLSHGSTRNISVAPWKVLGHILAISPTGSRKASAKRLEDKLLAAVKNIANRPIRGEFKAH